MTRKTDDIKKFFDLMKYSCKLLNENQHISQDQKAYSTLLNLAARANTNMNWKKRKLFQSIVTDFLQEKLSCYEFSTIFMNVYSGIGKKWYQLVAEIQQSIFEEKELISYYSKISDLLVQPNIEMEQKLNEMNQLLSNLFILCDDFRPDSAWDDETLKLYEKEFRSLVKEEFQNLEKYLH